MVPCSDPPSSNDSGLDAALDEFLDWAEAEKILPESAELPLPHVSLDEGTHVGSYRILRRIGTGGMGVVYEAQGEKGPVALKVLRGIFATPQALDRFQREMATIASLSHPSILPLLGSGVIDGVPYYVMPRVRGCSAATLIRRLRARRRPLRASEARACIVGSDGEDLPCENDRWSGSYIDWVAGVTLDIAEALEHAHSKGVVHRDVKPGNVMLTAEGCAVLVDFGLAAGARGEPLTVSGDFVGTLAYASPEQLAGEGADPRSDIYGLGTVLRELLSLEPPPGARTRSTALRRRMLSESPALGPDVPPPLRTICETALAAAPKRRYTSAGAMAADLRAFLAGQPIKARPPGALFRLARFSKRHPRLVSALVAGAMVSGLVALRALWIAGGEVRAGRAQLAEARKAALRVRSSLMQLNAARAASTVSSDLFHERFQYRRNYEEARHEFQAALRSAAHHYLAAEEAFPAHGAARRGRTELAELELSELLHRYADVYRTEDLERVESELTSLDPSHPLLSRLGRVTIDFLPAQVQWTVHRTNEEGVIASGNGALQLSDVPEGSYVATISRPGQPPCIYPFIVRRHGIYEADPDALPPEHYTVRLLDEAFAPAGWIPIPAGWSFLDDAPPRLSRVEGFAIQEDEVSTAEFASWLNHQFSGAPAPSFPDSATGETLGIWRSHRNGEGWVYQASDPADYPARGLTFHHVGVFVTQSQADLPLTQGIYLSLPSRAEWIRAARGADARRYPWGDDFDWSFAALHPSRGSLDLEPSPFPIGSFPHDLSPFGVRDMAGSVAEFARDRFAVIRDECWAMGGSYRSISPAEVAITAGRRTGPIADYDVGFRMVRLKLPDFFVSATTEAHWEDSFERADGSSPGNGWRTLSGTDLPKAAEALPRRMVHIEKGCLVLQGGVGNYSREGIAVHPLRASRRIEVRARLSLQVNEGDTERAFTIGFLPDLRDATCAPATVHLQPGPTWQLWIEPSRANPTTFRASSGEELELQLLLEEGTLYARLQAESGAMWEDRRHLEPLEARFLVLEAPNLIGGRMVVESVEVHSMDAPVTTPPAPTREKR